MHVTCFITILALLRWSGTKPMAFWRHVYIARNNLRRMNIFTGEICQKNEVWDCLWMLRTHCCCMWDQPLQQGHTFRVYSESRESENSVHTHTFSDREMTRLRQSPPTLMTLLYRWQSNFPTHFVLSVESGHQKTAADRRNHERNT